MDSVQDREQCIHVMGVRMYLISLHWRGAIESPNAASGVPVKQVGRLGRVLNIDNLIYTVGRWHRHGSAEMKCNGGNVQQDITEALYIPPAPLQYK